MTCQKNACAREREREEKKKRNQQHDRMHLFQTIRVSRAGRWEIKNTSNIVDAIDIVEPLVNAQQENTAA